MFDGEVVLIAGGLMALALLASLVAGRIRVPGLVLFLALGMLIGSDGLGWIAFSDYELARDIGVIAIALIIFEGGLAAGFSEIRPVLRPAIALAIVGTIATAVITGFAAAWLFDLSTLEGMLLGSIVASTDAAAIFAVLRGSTMRRRLAWDPGGGGGVQRPSRRPPGPGLHRLDPGSRLRRTEHGGLDGGGARDRHRSSAFSSAAVRSGRSARFSSARPACTRSPRSPRRHWPSAWPTSPTARASSPSTSPDSRSARPRCPRSGRSSPSMRGSHGWHS